LAGFTEAMTLRRLFFGLRNARAMEWWGLVRLEESMRTRKVHGSLGRKLLPFV